MTTETPLPILPTLTDVDVLSFPRTVLTPVVRPEAALVVQLVGPIASRGARNAFKLFLLDQVHAGRRRFVLDFSEAGYFDTDTIGVFLSVMRLMRTVGARLVCVELGEDLEAMLSIANLTDLLPSAPKVIDGLALMAEVAA